MKSGSCATTLRGKDRGDILLNLQMQSLKQSSTSVRFEDVTRHLASIPATDAASILTGFGKQDDVTQNRVSKLQGMKWKWFEMNLDSMIVPRGGAWNWFPTSPTAISSAGFDWRRRSDHSTGLPAWNESWNVHITNMLKCNYFWCVFGVKVTTSGQLAGQNRCLWIQLLFIKSTGLMDISGSPDWWFSGRCTRPPPAGSHSWSHERFRMHPPGVARNEKRRWRHSSRRG